jgi:hypothetical protein
MAQGSTGVARVVVVVPEARVVAEARVAPEARAEASELAVEAAKVALVAVVGSEVVKVALVAVSGALDHRVRSPRMPTTFTSFKTTGSLNFPREI